MRFSLKLRAILLVLLIYGILLPNQLFAKDVEEFACGNNFIHREVMVELQPGELRLRLDTDVDDQRLTSITLDAGPTLTANAPALAAFNRAIATWVSWFDDPVSILIEADLVYLSSGALGEASTLIYPVGYNSCRDKMVLDAGVNETICSSLPTQAQFNVTTITNPSGYSFLGNMSATKANHEAIGYDMSGYLDPAASIEFNTDFLPEFDFDRSDGIDPDKYDFEGIVLHEIGHALGFGSNVSSVDYWLDVQTPWQSRPRPLDLFRLLPGQGAANFTNASRIQVPAFPDNDPAVPVQVTYDGSNDLMMSTGTYYGDNYQPSHWKNDDITGNYLGLMDPTMGKGEQVKPLENDIVALGLSGWDVGQGPCAGNSLGDCNNDGIPLGVADMIQMQRYLIGDAGHSGNLCGYELNHYDNPFFPCEPTFGDYFFFMAYFTGFFTPSDLNPDCRYTEFAQSYGLNIVMPSNVDLLTNADPFGIFSETFTIQLENTNVVPIYVWTLTVPVHFPVSGGTGDVLYVFQNHQDYGSWSVTDPINPSGKPAVQFIGSSPVMVPALSTIDLFDVWYSYLNWTGHSIMNGELFSQVPARFPVATISTTPKKGGSRQPHWLMEVTLGSTPEPYGCDCEPGEADGLPPISILDVVYLINYKYKGGPAPTPYALCSGDADCDCKIDILDVVYIINYKYKGGPAPCDCDTWLINCGSPLRK